MIENTPTPSAEPDIFQRLKEQDALERQAYESRKEQYGVALFVELGQPALPKGTTPETVKSWNLLDTLHTSALHALHDEEWKMPEDVRRALEKFGDSEASDEGQLADLRILGFATRPTEFLARPYEIDFEEIKRSLLKTEDRNFLDVTDYFERDRNIFHSPIRYAYNEQLKLLIRKLAQRAIAGLPIASLEKLEPLALKNLQLHVKVVSYQHERVRTQAIYAPQDVNEALLKAHEAELAEHIALLKILFPAVNWDEYNRYEEIYNPRGAREQVWTGPESAHLVGCNTEQLAFMYPILKARKIEMLPGGGLVLDGRKIGPKPADAVNPISEETRGKLGDVL